VVLVLEALVCPDEIEFRRFRSIIQHVLRGQTLRLADVSDLVVFRRSGIERPTELDWNKKRKCIRS
jgi:hypothetical protein